MAHNAYVRAGGVWAALSDLTSVEMATFDLRQFQAVNGDLGGTWTPSAPVILGGAGLHVTGPFISDDSDVTIGHGRFLTVLGTSGGALGTMNALVGSVVNIAGTQNVTATGRLHVNSSGKIIVDSGGGLEVNGASAFTFKAASQSVQEATAFLTLSGTTQWVGGTVTADATSTVMLAAGAHFTNHGTTVLDGTQTVSGTTTFNAAVGPGDVFFTAGTVTIATATAFAVGGSLAANAAAPFSLHNVVTCNNQLVVASPGGFFLNSGATALLDDGSVTTQSGRYVKSGANAVDSPRFGNAPNTSVAFDPSVQDYWEVPALSGNTTYDLNTPAHPCVFRISQVLNVDPANTLTIRRTSDSHVLNIFAPTYQSWIDVKYDGSVMSVSAFGKIIP